MKSEKPVHEMVNAIVEDMEFWLNNDREGFMCHVKDIEKEWLRTKPKEFVEKLYESVMGDLNGK